MAFKMFNPSPANTIPFGQELDFLDIFKNIEVKATFQGKKQLFVYFKAILAIVVIDILKKKLITYITLIQLN